MTEYHRRQMYELERVSTSKQNVSNHRAMPLHYLGQLSRQDLKSCANRGEGERISASVPEGLLTLIINTENMKGRAQQIADY